MTFPEMMTSQEVAGVLRVTPQHVRCLAKQGDIPCIRIGKEYRFVREQLMERFPNLRVLMQQTT